MTKSRPASLTRLRLSLAELPSLARLAVPLVLGLSVSALISITDTIMLAPLGTEALAIVSLVSAVGMLLSAALYGMVSVVAVRIAAGFGAGDHCGVSHATRNGLALSALTGRGAAVLVYQ